MTSRSIALISTLAVCVAFAPAALAQDNDDDDDVEVRTTDRGLPEVRPNSPSGIFGTKGQKAVSSDAGLSVSNTSVSGVDGSTTTLTLRPAVDWFFAENISLGGFVGVDYTSQTGGSSSVISIGPRIGYNLPVSERMSVWPKIGFSLANTTVNTDAVGGIPDQEESNTSGQLNLFVPVMFHPVQHFFLGLGPALDLDLSGENKATTVAVRLTLGGWI
jgi:hypothetical protein